MVKIVKISQKMIILTKIEAKQYKRMGMPKEEIAIISNGIDLSRYAELSSKGAFKKKFNTFDGIKLSLYL
jgi:hypothetical protein